MMEVAEVSRTKFDPYVIGNNIRDLREKRKMTQMKAAEEMDMSLSKLDISIYISMAHSLSEVYRYSIISPGSPHNLI